MASKAVVVTIPHDLGRQGARRQIEQGLVQIRSQLHGKVATVEEQWAGDRLDFRVSAVGQTVTGFIDVMEQEVRVEVMLPWILATIAQKLGAKIQHQGTLLLEKK